MSFSGLIEKTFYGPQGPLEEYCDELAQAHQAYLGLEGVSSEELIEAKFQLMHWKRVVSQRLKAQAQASGQELALIFQTLASCGACEDDWRGLHKMMRARPEDPLADASFAKLLATGQQHKQLRRFRGGAYWESLRHLAGPQLDLGVIPNRSGKKQNFWHWARNPEWSNYHWIEDAQGEGVLFKGALLRPGDLFCIETNADGNGIFTLLYSPQSTAYHMGILGLLPLHGRKYPVVAETFEQGVRAIPLREFLSRRYTSTAEVLRLKDAPPQYRQSVSQSIMEALRNVKGYNFDTEDPDRTYLSCPSIAAYCFERANIPVIQQKSKIDHENIKRAVLKFHYTFFQSTMPVDYSTDPRLQRVAFLSHGQVEKMICRELACRKARQLIEANNFELMRPSLKYHLNLLGVKNIRAATALGHILGAVLGGFHQDNLPKGPPEAISIVPVFEKRMAKLCRKIFRQRAHTIDWDRPFSLKKFCHLD